MKSLWFITAGTASPAQITTGLGVYARSMSRTKAGCIYNNERASAGHQLVLSSDTRNGLWRPRRWKLERVS